MEDSLKGFIITLTIISIFITAIVNFAVVFPQEQGATFNGEDNDSYLMMENIEMDTNSYLGNLDNQSEAGFEQWDIEVGFMGSNTQKGAKGGINAYSGNIFTNLKVMAKQIFGQNSPVYIVLGTLAALTTLYGLYLFIKYLRTGS